MYNARSQYASLVTATLEIEAALLLNDYSRLCSSNPVIRMIKKREEPPAEGDDHVRIVHSVDIAGRYPWKTFEEFKAASESLEFTAPYGAWMYSLGFG
jgi:hypothetical protein